MSFNDLDKCQVDFETSTIPLEKVVMEKVLTSKVFLDRCKSEAEGFSQLANRWSQLDLRLLNWKETEDKWSMLECLMHLNSYAAYYFPLFEKAIDKANNTKPVEQFKTTWFGRKCVKSVHPSTRVSKKIKSPGHHNHNSTSSHGVAVIDEFIGHQRRLLRIVEKARKINLTKPKISVEIAKLLCLNLGEFMNFMCTHQVRHMEQATEVLERAQQATRLVTFE